MKKSIKITLITIPVVIALFFLVRFLSGPEDTWLCQAGQWVKHGSPSLPMPVVPCN